MKTVLILTFLPLVCFSSRLLFSCCVLQISAYPWLLGWLCIHHLWLVGPARGHTTDGVVEMGRGAAAQAGQAVLGWGGWRLFLQRSQRQHCPAATQRGWDGHLNRLTLSGILDNSEEWELKGEVCLPSELESWFLSQRTLWLCNQN